jgi:uncharacterized membrane protein
MLRSAPLADLPPAVAIHLCAALAATALGPVALWARRRGNTHPRLHRAAGYAWVTLMVMAALSALFIQGTLGPRWGGFGPIYLLIPFTLGTLIQAFRYLLRGNVQGHRRSMQGLYIGACLVAGAFTLLPGRLLGHWLGTQLGWL